MSSVLDLRILHASAVALPTGVALLLAGLSLEHPAAPFDLALGIAIVAALALHVFFLGGGAQAWRVARALIARGWQVFLSYRFQILILLVQLAFFAALLVMLGRPLVEALFSPVGEALSGYTPTNYIVFLLLGATFFPVLWASYHVSAVRIRGEQITGMFEALVPTAAGVEPLPFAYLLSTTLSSLVTLAATLLVLGLVLPRGALQVTNPHAVLAFAAILALGVVTMWGLGLVMGGLTTIFKEAGAASSLLRIVLVVFAGVYIPPGLLPAWGQGLSRVLPVTYAAEGARGALAEGLTLVDLLPQVGVLALFALGTSVGGTWLFHHLLDRARRAGTLYGY